MLDLRGVGVAVDHGSEPGRSRVQVEVAQNVEEVDVHAVGDTDHFGLIQQSPQLTVFRVAAHRTDRGDLLQGAQYLLIADVARVKDDRTPLERSQRLGPQEAVGVRDETNEAAHPRGPHPSTGTRP